LTKHVVICGGGYGGIKTALELDRLLLEVETQYRNTITITVIDKNDHHILLPSLPEIILNRGYYIVPYKEIFAKKRIRFIQSTIQAIDLDTKRITVSNARNSFESMGYDILVIALGSIPSMPHIPGLEQFAYPFNSIQDVKRIVNRMAEISRQNRSTIVIAGAGPTGVEVTGEIATYFADSTKKNKTKIILVSSSILENFPEHMRVWAKSYLQAIGVELKIGRDFKVVKVEEKSIVIQNGQKITTDLFIWTGGVKASALPKRAGLKIGDMDRVLVNTYLQSIDRHDVFVVGDCALILDDHGKPIPTSAQFAEQEGKTAAKNIAIAIIPSHEEGMKKYIPQNEGFAISIGPAFALARLGLLDQYGISASKIKKLIKMKYLKDITGISNAFRDHSISKF
jgi:NADH dehydrogenase